MTLAGWKRTPGTADQPVGTVAPVAPEAQISMANEFVVAELVDSHLGQPFEVLAPGPTAASEDLERALAEMDGTVEAEPVVDGPQSMAAFGSPESFGSATSAVPPVAAFGNPSVNPAGSAVLPPPPMFTPAAVLPPTSQQHLGVGGYTQQPPTFSPSFGPSGAPGMQFAPSGAPVPPTYTKASSSTGKTVGIVIGVVIGLVLLLSVAVIGALSMLGNKVKSSFNAISISNTLPSGYGTSATDPYATDPYADPTATDPYATDPYATYPSGADPSGAPSTIAAPSTGLLTGFEVLVSKRPEDFIARNSDGPVKFPVGEGCAVFEINTQSYGAFRCGAGQMNAQLVLAGTGGTVVNDCQSTATARAGYEVPVEFLWLVNYEDGQAECFIRSSPQWGMFGEPILSIPGQ